MRKERYIASNNNITVLNTREEKKKTRDVYRKIFRIMTSPFSPFKYENPAWAVQFIYCLLQPPPFSVRVVDANLLMPFVYVYRNKNPKRRK
jgi:hypothetical protein